MSRPLRVQAPGAVYHVGSRGVRRTNVFRDDADRRVFLFLLDATVRRFGWACGAYCLMTNHFHLVVQTPEPNIAAGMQYLKGRYAQWFNERHGVEGHVFERRYWAELVETPGHLAEVSRYVVLNPVRAGICRHPGEWPWSSYRATAGLEPVPRLLDTAFVLGQFTAVRQTREQAYETFVADRPTVEQGARGP